MEETLQAKARLAYAQWQAQLLKQKTAHLKRGVGAARQYFKQFFDQEPERIGIQANQEVRAYADGLSLIFHPEPPHFHLVKVCPKCGQEVPLPLELRSLIDLGQALEQKVEHDCEPKLSADEQLVKLLESIQELLETEVKKWLIALTLALTGAKKTIDEELLRGVKHKRQTAAWEQSNNA